MTDNIKLPARWFAGWLVSNSEGDDDFINNEAALAGRHYKGGAPLRLEASFDAGNARLNAALVPDEPNWSHPKIQGLIGSEARLRIAIDLVWKILEDPNQEFSAGDMEYWDTLHDDLKAALAAAPEPPERDRLRATQASAVMPLIGPLLDAWECCSQACREELPELDKQLRRINRAMEHAPEPQGVPEPADEVLPCPFCGEPPAPLARPDNVTGTEFFFALACACGGYSACAHKMAVRKTPEQARADAIAAWNRRAAHPQQSGAAAKFRIGDTVRKIKGSQWHGTVVGTYSTDLTPESYAVESSSEKGSVQIYPAAALEAVGEQSGAAQPEQHVPEGFVQQTCPHCNETWLMESELEQERKPLTDKQVARMFGEAVGKAKDFMMWPDYLQGVRDAERHHGITRKESP